MDERSASVAVVAALARPHVAVAVGRGESEALALAGGGVTAVRVREAGSRPHIRARKQQTEEGNFQVEFLKVFLSSLQR